MARYTIRKHKTAGYSIHRNGKKLGTARLKRDAKSHVKMYKKAHGDK